VGHVVLFPFMVFSLVLKVFVELINCHK
jgi:hypothetical protein